MEETFTVLEKYKIAIPIPQIYLIPEYITEAEETYLTKKIDQVGNSNEVIKPDLSISIRVGGWKKLNGRRSMYWGGTLSPKGRLIPQNPPSFMTNEWPYVFTRLEKMNLFKKLPSHSPSPLSDNNNNNDGSYLAPNHCLVNEYNPGDGILPHVDGPAYLPTVATISLEGDTIYEFHCYSDQYEGLFERLTRVQVEGDDEKNEKDENEGEKEQVNKESMTDRSISSKVLFSLFVPRRSLLIIESECYDQLLHSIPARMFDDFDKHIKPCINCNLFSTSSTSHFNFLNDNLLPRNRRLSLTCRRIDKVLSGLKSL